MSAMPHHHQAVEKEYEHSISRSPARDYSDGNGAPLAPTMTLSAEQFEKLYLGPKTEVAGDLRKTFANPTPM